MKKHRNKPTEILDWGGGGLRSFPRQGQCLSSASAQLWDGKEQLQKPTVAHPGALEGLYPGSSDPYAVPFALSTLPLAFPMPPSLQMTSASQLTGHPHPAPFSRTSPRDSLMDSPPVPVASQDSSFLGMQPWGCQGLRLTTQQVPQALASSLTS